VGEGQVVSWVVSWVVSRVVWELKAGAMVLLAGDSAVGVI
jgi:hypothetical protein